jgi:hypothetical protein
MTSYVYTASGTSQQSANLATDKIRIATTTSAIHYETGSPKVLGTGAITANTVSKTVTGAGTSFTTEINLGEWLCGTGGGVVWGQVATIANNTSLTFTTNSTANATSAAYAIAPTSDGFAYGHANAAIIPANFVERTIIVGQGNVVAFLTASTATPDEFTITELGMPHAITGTE